MSAVMELSIAAELDGGCSRPTPALPGRLSRDKPVDRRGPEGSRWRPSIPSAKLGAIRTEPVMPLEGLQAAQ
jgi:hypothetical protein